MKKFITAAVAIANGLGPGDIFENECGEIRRIVREPGEHLTRGELGDQVYSEVAMIWTNGEYVPASEQDVMEHADLVSWKVWDSVWGYLPL